MNNYLFLLVLLILFEIVLNTQPKKEPTYYEILDVKNDAPRQEIVKSYRTLALKYHPDKNKDPKASEIMKGINEAYENLFDDERRKDYDQILANKPLKTYSRKRKYSKGASSSQANKRARANKQQQYHSKPILFNANSSNFKFTVYHNRTTVHFQGNLYTDNCKKITINGGSNNLEIHGNNLNLSDNSFSFSIETKSVKINIYGVSNKLNRKDIGRFKFDYEQPVSNPTITDVIINGHSNKFEIYNKYDARRVGSNLIEIHGDRNNCEFYGGNIKLNNEKFKMGDDIITKQYFNFGQTNQNFNFSKEKSQYFNFGGFQQEYYNFPGETSQNPNNSGNQSQTWNFGEPSKPNVPKVPKTFNLFPETPSNFGEKKDEIPVKEFDLNEDNL
ncbi:hypothetical protein ACQ4LE_005091 [Meloidogyne hapla]|uniref:J domain-containing protein n=1 Tax=Meloidogyne hapla TaxID=6305 RepID=A0A1I8BBN8_MELHA